MQEIEKANNTLEAATKTVHFAIDDLKVVEDRLKARLDNLNELKKKIAIENGKVNEYNDRDDCDNNDLVEINAGGKIVTAKRSTLTYFKGSRLEAIFSGRWDKKLSRDGDGRIFLDVNPMCFQNMVDHVKGLSAASSSSKNGNSLKLFDVNDEYFHILMQHFELFGLDDVLGLSASYIVTSASQASPIHEWLSEDGSHGNFRLLYKTSTETCCNSSFHSSCDKKGPTLTVIATKDGIVLGGYTNTEWAQGGWERASKAFLFVLSGRGIDSAFRMKLKKDVVEGIQGILNDARCGPTFGGTNYPPDLRLNGNRVHCDFGRTYEVDPSKKFIGPFTTTIEYMEVYKICKPAADGSNIANANFSTSITIEDATKNLKRALRYKRACLTDFEEEIESLEYRFKDEERLLPLFCHEDPGDIITLDVCGSKITVSRNTLMLCERSFLATQIANPEKGRTDTNVRRGMKEWNHKEVAAWMNIIEGVQESVASIFEENQITGRELLALGSDGMITLGVKRVGSVFVLLDEINKQLKKEKIRSQEILVDHSPYCVEKIMDHLRLMRAYVDGRLKHKPLAPFVCESERLKFEEVVNHFFPDETSRKIVHDGKSVSIEF